MNKQHQSQRERNASKQQSASFLAGGGEMGQLIREFNWANTPLGEPDSWPQSLRTTVRLMLNTNHPVFIFWGEQLTCFYNDAYRVTLGPERHPASLGARGIEVWAEIWHIIEPEITQVMAGRGAIWSEQKMTPITRHGQVDNVWWTYSSSPIDDETTPNGIGGVLVICNDVTVQHNATEALKQERERLMALFQQAPGFLAVLYGREHIFNIVNDSYKQLVGKRNVVGLSVREALPELAEQGFYELLDQVYTSGKPYIGQNVAVTLQNDTATEPATHYLNFIYQPIRDKAGEIIGIFVEGYDNTPARLTEIALRETLEKNNAIIENTKDLICIFDKAGFFLSINNKSLEILGYQPDEMIGHNYTKFLLTEDKESTEQVFAGVLAGNQAKDFRNQLQHKDGHTVQMLWSAVWVAEQSKLFAVGKDITEWLKTEELVRHAQRAEAIGQLTGGMAHDFNNLLTVILGNAEMLAQELPQDSEHLELAKLILKASERGAALTQRLLAFARRQPLAPTVVNIKKMLEGLKAMLSRTLGEHIQIEIACPDKQAAAMVDEAQLESAILNLCINSRDAMPSGGRLTISAAHAYLDEDYARSNLDVQAGDYILISVADTGIGIPAEHLPRVFDPFFTTKDVEHGTGLGLSMVIGFVKQSKGHVAIYSEVNQGTVVKLFIPQAIDDVKPTSTVLAPERPVGGTETILLVEDNELVRQFAKLQLKQLGYQVLSAENGHVALEIMRERADIDLLFTDIIMPGGINGRELAQQARLVRPALKVLFTSGYSNDTFAKDANFEAQDQMLNKPYTRLALAKSIRQVLDKKSG